MKDVLESRLPLISSPPVFVSFDQLFSGVEDMLLNSPCLKELSPAGLYSHVYWYWSRGTMSWAQNEEGAYTGVCLIKLIDDLRDMDSWYVHDPDGKCIFIEEVVSDGPETWQRLFDQLHDIWGNREFVIWDRRDRTQKCPRIYRWDQYIRVLNRLTMKKEGT